MNTKYEFTGEEKTVLGRKLRRIRALAAVGVVAAGTVGGWIEDERNLSVYGNAWVCGDAQVYGDAQVCGDAQVYGDASRTPLVITGGPYVVTITDSHMKIGCQFRTLAEWAVLGRSEVAAIDGTASATLWGKAKDALLALARASGREF